MSKTAIKHAIHWVLLLPLVGCLACNREEVVNTNIPFAPVGFQIDVSIAGPDNSLREGMIYNTKIYDEAHPATLSVGYGSYGYCGVVVIRASNDRLYAFDLCCPYEANKSAVLKVDGFFLKCPKCGSQFEIGNGLGNVNQGPATQPLKAYQVVSQATYIYRVCR